MGASQVLGRCCSRYDATGESEQVAFKGTAKGFLRAYDFIASVTLHSNR